MAKLFDVIETTTVKYNDEEFEVRLLVRDGNDWGIDTTLRMESTFGYTKEGARKVNESIIKSFTDSEKEKAVGIKVVCLMEVKDQKELDRLNEDSRVKTIYPHLTEEHYKEAEDFMENLIFPDGEVELEE